MRPTASNRFRFQTWMAQHQERLARTNPHTGLPAQGRRQPAGTKMARRAAAHALTLVGVRGRVAK